MLICESNKSSVSFFMLCISIYLLTVPWDILIVGASGAACLGGGASSWGFTIWNESFSLEYSIWFSFFFVEERYS